MLPRQEVVIATVLRAGLPFHQGFRIISIMQEVPLFLPSRAYSRVEGQIEIRFDSVYTPDLTGKQLLLVDPMLATGKSLVITYRELLKSGEFACSYAYRFSHCQPARCGICGKRIGRRAVDFVDSCSG